MNAGAPSELGQNLPFNFALWFVVLYQEAALEESVFAGPFGVLVIGALILGLVALAVVIKRAKKKKPQHLQTPLGRAAIFVSYRRDDASDVTGRICDRLIQHFGKAFVFKDVDNIPLGIDFRKHLGDAVGRCDVLLAVIGKRWLTGDVGQRRIDDIGDFVRIEIEAALQRDIPVVPVLVQNGSIPRPEDLPETMKSLVYRNGIPVRPDPDFHNDMERLIRGIEGYIKDENKKRGLSTN